MVGTANSLGFHPIGKRKEVSAVLVFHGRRPPFLNAQATYPLTEGEVKFVQAAAAR